MNFGGAGGRQALGTTVIRQNYQNSAISTRGIDVSAIVNNPVNAQNFYFLALGSGPMANRVAYYYKRRGLL